MSVIDNIFTYAWVAAYLLIVGLSSLYVIVHLAHPQDTPFARSCTSRICIWLGFVFSSLPIIMVFIDVSLNESIKTEWKLAI